MICYRTTFTIWGGYSWDWTGQLCDAYQTCWDLFGSNNRFVSSPYSNYTVVITGSCWSLSFICLCSFYPLVEDPYMQVQYCILLVLSQDLLLPLSLSAYSKATCIANGDLVWKSNIHLGTHPYVLRTTEIRREGKATLGTELDNTKYMLCIEG